ncbi:hypothetical protein GW17_00057121 [Ensete ventricosum]|nr:hypothetical protein GW17_00057121 [Ensete ventricosum]
MARAGDGHRVRTKRRRRGEEGADVNVAGCGNATRQGRHGRASRGMERAEEETSAGTELVALASMGPKLEDFLGGPLGRYSSAEDAACPAEGVYDSDLKTIAAGCLRGLPVEQQEPQSAKEAAPPVESRKTTADTFGQRTSIYRGVTR